MVKNVGSGVCESGFVSDHHGPADENTSLGDSARKGPPRFLVQMSKNRAERKT